MAVSDSYREFVLEQLNRVRPVTARRMFGGVGLYADAAFFALIDNDTLFFKVDDATRPAFEAAGMAPFQPFGEGSTPMRGYYEVPADVLERPERLGEWMSRAVAVALAKPARAAKRRAPVKRPAAHPGETVDLATDPAPGARRTVRGRRPGGGRAGSATR